MTKFNKKIGGRGKRFTQGVREKGCEISRGNIKKPCLSAVGKNASEKENYLYVLTNSLFP